MALLSMHGISLSFGGDHLLNDIDLNIEIGDRACLIGRNGTGKSSLLKLINGHYSPDEGDIRSAKDFKTAYLPQDIPENLTGNIIDVVRSGLTQTSSSQHHSEVETEQIIGKIISHLSLDPYAEFETLSGGQKRRALLARALACEPDLLLLDEPTNHLDIESICWMEEYLLRHCKTFLFVTHDRSFLRRISNRIIDLDRGSLAQWNCNYDDFMRRKSDLLHDEEVRNKVFDKKMAKEEVWIRQGIKARRTRDEGRVRALMTMRDERRKRRSKTGNANLNLIDAELSGRKAIHAKHITFAYENETPIIKDFSAQIMRGDKIGIIGTNGSGKTTLLNLLIGKLAPLQGEVIHGTKLEIAYYDQHRATLDNNATVAQNIGDGLDTLTINGQPRHVISYLQDFLFTTDRANSPVKVLSGGERNRLMLAILFSKASNLLIMDEPTNDLDTETLELLEEQLMNYKGTVLLVSHDRAFLDNVATSLLLLEEHGKITEHIGSYSDLMESRAEQKNIIKKAGKKKSSTTKSTFGFNQKRELKALPKQIEKLEQEQTDLHNKMADPNYFLTSPEDITANTKREAEITTELETAYDRWTELEELKA